MPMKRHKTPRKQFPHRLARRKPRHHIPPPMLQNKNSCQWRTPRRRIHRLPMPRRPIHPHLEMFFSSVILSGVIGPRSGAITQSKDPYPLPSPAPAAPQGVSTSDRPSSLRTIIRSSLKTSTSSRAVHNRVVVLFPAPECPTNKFPTPSPRTIPHPCNSIPFSCVSRCIINNSSKGYPKGSGLLGEMPEKYSSLICRRALQKWLSTSRAFVRPTRQQDSQSQTEAGLLLIGRQAAPESKSVRPGIGASSETHSTRRPMSDAGLHEKWLML